MVRRTSEFKINFKLKKPEEIVPWGENRSCLSWFGLTDSELWITVGERTIYEYSDAALGAWGGCRYNDYQLSRFLEDFSQIFDCIRESVPRKFYDIIEEFPTLFAKWHEFHDDCNDEVFDRLFDEEYLPFSEWFYNRVFDSGHLVGGPNIGCFRCGDMIKIWWRSDYLLENGESIWTSPSGFLELSYNAFADEVKRFFGEFHAEMDKQVSAALAMDWGKVEVDKKRLAEENGDRRSGFDQKTALLSEDTPKKTDREDWDRIGAIYKKMLSAEEKK